MGQPQLDKGKDVVRLGIRSGCQGWLISKSKGLETKANKKIHER